VPFAKFFSDKLYFVFKDLPKVCRNDTVPKHKERLTQKKSAVENGRQHEEATER